MQIWNVLILLLDHNTSWRKHLMEKHVLSDQTGFLSGQNLSLTGQMTSCLLTKIICRLELFYNLFALFRFGPSSLTISKFVPHICKLLGDPNSQVRDLKVFSVDVWLSFRIFLKRSIFVSHRFVTVLSIVWWKFTDTLARK